MVIQTRTSSLLIFSIILCYWQCRKVTRVFPCLRPEYETFLLLSLQYTTRFVQLTIKLISLKQKTAFCSNNKINIKAIKSMQQHLEIFSSSPVSRIMVSQWNSHRTLILMKTWTRFSYHQLYTFDYCHIGAQSISTIRK